MNERLYRSRDDRVISGVAAGLADQLALDPSLVRVAWVILAIVSGGLLALVYLVMMFVVPEEPDAGTAWTARSSAEPESDTPAPGTTTPGAAAPGAATPPSGAAASGDRPTETIPPPGWDDSRPDERERRRDERAARRDARHEERLARRTARRDSNTGPVVLGLLLVVAGAWLLARRYLPAVDFDRLWPIGLVVAGIVLIVLAIRPGAREP